MEKAADMGLLLGTDKTRYLNLHAKLERDYTLGNNLYPTKRSETLRALNKYVSLRDHHRNNINRENSGRGNGGRGDTGRGRGNPRRQSGTRNEAPHGDMYTLVQPANQSTPIDQVQCFNCKAFGHRVRDCPEEHTNGHTLVTHGV